MYILLLNDMRAAHSEQLDPVVRADTLEQLFQFIKSEKVESYTDGKDGESGYYGNGVAYNKAYRAGGPLEWCNPITFESAVCPPLEEWNRYAQHVIRVPSRDEAMAAAGPRWDQEIGGISEAPIDAPSSQSAALTETCE